MLFSEWWNIWISELSIRPSTESNYSNQYKNHFKLHFGHRPISNIEKHDIKVFRKILEKDLQPNTINTYLRPLCQCLLEANRRKIISEYPCEGIGSLQEGQPQIDPFSFEELRHFLDYLLQKSMAWHDLILFWSRTGLRPGELYEKTGWINRIPEVAIFNTGRRFKAAGDRCTKTARGQNFDAQIICIYAGYPTTMDGQPHARQIRPLVEDGRTKAPAAQIDAPYLCDITHRGRGVY